MHRSGDREPRPVIDVPDHRPRSPLIVVELVLVTVLAPKTAKLAAERRFIVAAAAGLRLHRLNAAAKPYQAFVTATSLAKTLISQ
jgi:hypothetical protein